MFGRFGLAVASLIFAGCGAAPSAQELAKQEATLARMEAQLARMEARMHTLENTPLPVEGFEVKLPPSTPATPATVVTRIAISVAATETFVDGKGFADADLPTHLKALATTSPEASVIIQAPDTIDHKRVVEALDAIKKAGFTHIAIATQAED